MGGKKKTDGPSGGLELEFADKLTLEAAVAASQESRASAEHINYALLDGVENHIQETRLEAFMPGFVNELGVTLSEQGPLLDFFSYDERGFATRKEDDQEPPAPPYDVACLERYQGEEKWHRRPAEAEPSMFD